MNREDCAKTVRPLLSERRFHHSECVAQMAEHLAEKYGADPEKAWCAGMLHDILKEQPKEEQLKMMDEFGIILTDEERSAPKLWHAILGAAYLERRVGISDREILNAVRYHTTARAGMSLLEKVLFVADFISDDRQFDGVEPLRKAAKKSLEQAVLLGCAVTVQDLAEHHLAIHPDTIAAYNWSVLHAE